MPKKRRNSGREILRGIRQLQRGEHGRVINVAASSAMTPDKKQRLERAGWTVGDTAGFLGPCADKARSVRPSADRDAYARDIRAFTAALPKVDGRLVARTKLKGRA